MKLARREVRSRRAFIFNRDDRAVYTNLFCVETFFFFFLKKKNSFKKFSCAGEIGLDALEWLCITFASNVVAFFMVTVTFCKLLTIPE